MGLNPHQGLKNEDLQEKNELLYCRWSSVSANAELDHDLRIVDLFCVLVVLTPRILILFSEVQIYLGSMITWVRGGRCDFFFKRKG